MTTRAALLAPPIAGVVGPRQPLASDLGPYISFLPASTGRSLSSAVLSAFRLYRSADSNVVVFAASYAAIILSLPSPCRRRSCMPPCLLPSPSVGSHELIPPPPPPYPRHLASDPSLPPTSPPPPLLRLMATPNVEFPLRPVDDDQEPRPATAAGSRAGAATAWLWGRELVPSVTASSPREPDDDDSWEVRAFAEDSRSVTGGTWPPRSYSCTFCRREFRSAQALGGHMNVHRQDRARLRESERFQSPSRVSRTDYPPGLCLLYPLPAPFPSSMVGINALITNSLINPSSNSPTPPSALVSQQASSSPPKRPTFAPHSLAAAASSLDSPLAFSSAFTAGQPLSPSLPPPVPGLVNSGRSSHSFFPAESSDRNGFTEPSTCFSSHYLNDDPKDPRELRLQTGPVQPYQRMSLKAENRCLETIDFDQPEFQLKNEDVPFGVDLELRLGY